MLSPPTFSSLADFVQHVDDVEHWWPYVAEILDRHGVRDAEAEPEAGYNATWPTFLIGDLVVKLFGYAPSWRESSAAERGAGALVATDPEIMAPAPCGDGRLFEDPAAPWPYLMTSRMPGIASWRADLEPERWRAIATELGRQIRRIHALVPVGVATEADWPALDVTAAAARSSLPPHLVAQAESYVAELGPFERVFVHGDVVANHVFVEHGRFAGIIDWGDAMVIDRHAELIQIYRDTFGCDTTLFRLFLDASGWPVDDRFPRRAMGMALHRQAIGLAQHRSMDVFEPIAAKFPLRDIATLDELATELFAV